MGVRHRGSPSGRSVPPKACSHRRGPASLQPSREEVSNQAGSRSSIAARARPPEEALRAQCVDRSFEAPAMPARAGRRFASGARRGSARCAGRALARAPHGIAGRAGRDSRHRRRRIAELISRRAGAPPRRGGAHRQHDPLVSSRCGTPTYGSARSCRSTSMRPGPASTYRLTSVRAALSPVDEGDARRCSPHSACARSYPACTALESARAVDLIGLHRIAAISDTRAGNADRTYVRPQTVRHRL